MDKPIKTRDAIAVVFACLVLALIFINQTTKQRDVVLQSIQPSSQLAQVTPSATLSLSPSTQSVAVNGTFTVNVNLNTGGQAVYGIDVNRIRFNPAILQVVGQVTPGLTNNFIMIINNVDNTAGTIQFSQVLPLSDTGKPVPYNGNGTIASITFKAVAAGTSNISFDFTLGSGLDSNVAGSGGDILASVSGGSYTVTSPDSTAPTAPGTPALSVMSSTQINLTWTASTDNVWVTGYRVERCSGSATCTTFAQIATPTVTSYSDSALTPSTLYRYRVRATDALSNLSAYSGIANATTQDPPDTTAPTISGIALSAITTTGVTITWTTNENASTKVEYGLTTAYGSNTTEDTAKILSHSVTLSGLQPGTAYHYRVWSRDAAGNWATSIDNVFTTQSSPDVTNPLPPTGITATPTGETQIQLSWTAALDQVVAGANTSGVVSYQIFRNGVQVGTSASTAYLDTGLTSDTAYSYQITSVDLAGHISTKSVSVNATTLALSLAVQRKIILNLEGASITQRNVSGVVEFLNPSTSAKIYQASIVTDASGHYTLSVPSGLIPTVTLRPVIFGYIPRLIANVNLRDTTVLDVAFPKLPAGDFNGDKEINTLDFSYMNSKWGTADTLADVNRDGAVNTLDFSYLSNNWLLVGE